MVYEAVVTSGIDGMFILIGFIILAVVVAGSLKYTPSRRYRNLIVDMYVVGITRQHAIADKVDLEAELKEYKKMMRKQALKEQGLSSVIEDELKEKIANVQDEEKPKK